MRDGIRETRWAGGVRVASPFRVLVGARYLAGFWPRYVSAEVSVVTERVGLSNPDTSIVRQQKDQVSGLVDGVPAVRPLAASYRQAPFRERGKR